MTTVRFRFDITGRAAGDQTWAVSGHVEGESGDFPDLLHEAMRDGFIKLTKGKAVYGHPGLGCVGPYRITEFKLTHQPQE